MHPKQRFAVTAFSKTGKHVFLKQFENPMLAIELTQEFLAGTDAFATFAINMETGECFYGVWR